MLQCKTVETADSKHALADQLHLSEITAGTLTFCQSMEVMFARSITVSKNISNIKTGIWSDRIVKDFLPIQTLPRELQYIHIFRTAAMIPVGAKQDSSHRREIKDDE